MAETMAEPPVAPARNLIPRTRGWGVALAATTALVSGVAVFLNSYGVRRFPDPTTYTTAKNLVAAVLLAGLVSLAGVARTDERWTPPRSLGQRAGLVAIGLIGGSVGFVLFFEGLARASSTNAAFIHKTLVVWVALLAVPLLRERIGAPHVLAIALLVWGHAVLAGDVDALGLGTGELMILVATLCWAVEVVVAKRVLGTGISSLTVGVARMGIGTLALLGWAAARGELQTLVDLSASAWSWALITGFVLFLYVSTWYAALARSQAVDVTAVLVAAAVITAGLNTAVKGAPLMPRVTGLVLIAVGGALAVIAALRSGRSGVNVA